MGPDGNSSQNGKFIDRSYINELVKNMHDGDKESATILYDLMYFPLYSFIYKKIRNKNETEDIVQDTFCIIIRRVKSHLFIRDAFSYIFKVASNEIYHYFKRMKKQILFSENDVLNIEDVTKDEITESVLFNFIYQSLDERDKNIFKLKGAGYTNEETADKMGISVSTIKRREIVIREKIKKEIRIK